MVSVIKWNQVQPNGPFPPEGRQVLLLLVQSSTGSIGQSGRMAMGYLQYIYDGFDRKYPFEWKLTKVNFEDDEMSIEE